MNQELTKALRDVATIKKAKGANKFSIGSYLKAASFVSNLATPISEIDLLNTKGIGPKIASSIQEFIDKGKLQYIEDNADLLEGSIKIEELLKVEGIGEKAAQNIYEVLKITKLEELKTVVDNGEIFKVFKQKSVDRIKRGLDYLEKTRGRIRLDHAITLAKKIAEYMDPFVSRIEFCGSIRRGKSTVGDVDLIIISKNNALENFQKMPFIDEIIDAGEKKVSVWIKGVRVDCYALPKEHFESGVMHLTGSKDHNAKLRLIAKRKVLKLSQYGLFNSVSGDRVDNGTEVDIYKILGFEWIPPQHREGLDEFSKYTLGNKVELLSKEDIKYDFHVHSTWSDGKSSIEKNVEFAQEYELKGIGIADHSQSLKIAGGLSIENLRKRNQEITELRKKFLKMEVCKVMEVDIKGDGSLDYPDEVLDELDIVIASIHTGTKQDVTEIYKKAIQTGKVHIIGHITGRLINERPGYEFNIEAVLQECKKHNVAIELNCQPSRLDADEHILSRCKALGIKVAFGSDAHEEGQISYVKTFGLQVARRAWLTKGDLYGN